MKFLKKFHKTPLHIAIEKQNTEMFQLLLTHKEIDPNQKSI